jgi:hypothetical protein
MARGARWAAPAGIANHKPNNATPDAFNIWDI